MFSLFWAACAANSFSSMPSMADNGHYSQGLLPLSSGVHFCRRQLYSGYSARNQHLYVFSISPPLSVRKFRMNVCLNLSNCGGNIHTLLPSAVDGTKQIMNTAVPRVGISG